MNALSLINSIRAHTPHDTPGVSQLDMFRWIVNCQNDPPLTCLFSSTRLMLVIYKPPYVSCQEMYLNII